ALTAHAQLTKISPFPLASSSVSVVKPNVMFILDDSGSMAWDYLPDVANFSSGTYGEKSNHCNGMYYNPKVTYTPPVKADGTSFPNSDCRIAWTNGFNSSGDKDLKNSVYYTYIGTEDDLGFTYKSNGSVNTSKPFYEECDSD